MTVRPAPAFGVNGNGNPMNRVKEESHGTHVAGIIAALRRSSLRKVLSLHSLNSPSPTKLPTISQTLLRRWSTETEQLPR